MNEQKENMAIENNVEPVQTKEVKPKKKKTKAIILSILIIIAIGIGLLVGYQKLTSNPLSIYKKAINNTYKLLNGYIEDAANKTEFALQPLEEPFTINMDFTVNSNTEELAVLTDYKYHLSAGLNYPQEQLYLDLGIENENQEGLNLLLAYLNEHAYLESEEIFDRILDLGTSELNFSEMQIEIETINYEDLQIILKEMKDILNNSFDEDKFSMKEETININDEDIKTKRITYLLDEENMMRTLKYIQSEMLKNDELINALVSVSGLTEEELRNSLEEEIDLGNYTEIEMNLYVNGINNHIIAGNLTQNEEVLIRFTNQEEELNILIGDEYEFMTITKIDNTIDFSYNDYGDEILGFTIKSDDDSMEMSISASDTSDVTLNLKISNMASLSNSFGANITFGMIVEDASNSVDLELSGTISIEKKELDMPDTTNSVDINSLTEEELNTIYENLYTVIENLGLASSLNNVL